MRLRQAEHEGLVFCANAASNLHSPTWASLDQLLENEVASLRALLGGRPIWSSMLCERLRSLCQTQGLLPLFGRKGLEPPQVQRESAFWRGAPMSREAMDLLFGSLPRNRLTCKDKREGYAWVYYFKEPETALLHLISHPAFGAGVGLLPEVVQNSIRVAAAVLNFVGFHPTEQPGPGRFVVVLLTWQSPRSPDDFAIPDLHEDLLLSETTLPVGPDLAQEADAARRRTMLSPRAASWPLDQLLQSVLCKDSPISRSHHHGGVH